MSYNDCTSTAIEEHIHSNLINKPEKHLHIIPSEGILEITLSKKASRKYVLNSKRKLKPLKHLQFKDTGDHTGKMDQLLVDYTFLSRRH